MFSIIRTGIVAVMTAAMVGPALAARAANLTYVTSFGGTYGSGNGQFKTAIGVAVDSSGNVYVADDYSNQVDRFNPSNFSGTFTSFGTGGSGNGQFTDPTGVAVDSSGNVYVADTSNGSRLVQFNPSNFSGTFTSFGTQGNGNGQFYLPFGVAVDSSSNVYVADTSNYRIVQLKSGNISSVQVPQPSDMLGILALGVIGLVAKFKRLPCP